MANLLKGSKYQNGMNCSKAAWQVLVVLMLEHCLIPVCRENKLLWRNPCTLELCTVESHLTKTSLTEVPHLRWIVEKLSSKTRVCSSVQSRNSGDDTTPADVLLLRHLWNIAAKKWGASMKQSPIMEFVYDTWFFVWFITTVSVDFSCLGLVIFIYSTIFLKFFNFRCDLKIQCTSSC
jgi:hypothetical protein